MSICRWSDVSDIYMTYSSGGLTCWECPANDGDDFKMAGQGDAIRHLFDHSSIGHKVDWSALPTLMADGIQDALSATSS